MAKLVIINNIFNPEIDREDYDIKNQKVFEVLETHNLKYQGFKEVEYVFSINGVISTNFEYPLKDNDELIIAPIPSGGGDGKNPLAMVAMIALTIAAPYAAQGFMGATAGSVSAGLYGGLSGTLIYGGLQGAFMLAGGLLINAAFSTNTPSTNISSNLSETSTTYSFDAGSNAVAEGTARPFVIGSPNLFPPIIGEYFSHEGDKRYYNALYLLNDGEIDDVTDIKINDQDLDTYDNVSYEIRYGRNDQAVVNSYDEQETYSISRNINEQDDEETYQTVSNAINAIEIAITLTSGLYDLTNGDYENKSISFEISYKKSSSSTYTVFQTVNLNTIYKSPKTLIYTIDNLSRDVYDIKVKRLSSYSTSTMIADAMQLEFINEIIYADFIYPNKALLHLKGFATEDMNNSRPAVQMRVHNNALRYFEDNAFISDATKNISNPAYACLQVIKRAGVKDKNINFEEFEVMADYSTELELECHLVLDTVQDLSTALELISPLGFSKVVQEGTSWTPIVDKPIDVAQQKFLLTRGNITEDSFSIDYVSFKERANVIEVTYWDKENDYVQTTIQVQTDNYDATSKEIKASRNLYGCVSEQQAYMYAHRLKRRNERLSKTVSLGSSLTLLSAKLGQPIDVAYEYMTNSVTDGRILNFNANIVTLDEELTFEAGKNYNIDIMDQTTDEVYSFQIENTEDTTDTVTITNNENQIFYKYDVYKIVETEYSDTDLYTLDSITSNMDFDYTISGFEYVKEVYEFDTEIPPALVYTQKATTNLKVEELLLPRQDGSIEAMLVISFQSNKLSNTILLDGIKIATTSSNTYIHKDTFIKNKFYQITVNEIVTTYQFMGILTPTNKVQNVSVAYDSGIYTITWDEVADLKHEYYEVVINSKTYKVAGSSIEFNNLAVGEYTVEVYSVNSFGNRSESSNYTLNVVDKSLTDIVKDTKTEIEDLEVVVIDTAADIERLDTTIEEETSARVSSMQTLSASVTTLGEDLETVEVNLQTTNDIAVEANSWSASSNKWIIDPDGYITGYSFSNGTNQQSQFKILAEKFIVGSGLNSLTPFVMDGDTIKMTAFVEFAGLGLNSGSTTINGDVIETSEVFVNNLNATGGIVADEISANTVIGNDFSGNYYLGGVLEGCTLRGCVIDLSGNDNLIVTDYIITIAMYNADNSLYTDAFLDENLNEYRIPTISTVKEASLASNVTSGTIVNGLIQAYNVGNAGHNVKTAHIIPTLTASVDTEIIRWQKGNTLATFPSGTSIYYVYIGGEEVKLSFSTGDFQYTSNTGEEPNSYFSTPAVYVNDTLKISAYSISEHNTSPKTRNVSANITVNGVTFKIGLYGYGYRDGNYTVSPSYISGYVTLSVVAGSYTLIEDFGSDSLFRCYCQTKAGSPNVSQFKLTSSLSVNNLV